MQTSLEGMSSALPRQFGSNREKSRRPSVNRTSPIARPVIARPVIAFCFLKEQITSTRVHIADLIRRPVSVDPKIRAVWAKSSRGNPTNGRLPIQPARSSRANEEPGLFLGDGGGVAPDGGVRDRRRERERLLVFRRGEVARRLVGERCIEIRRLDRRGVGARRPFGRCLRPCGVGARRGEGLRPAGDRRRCCGRIAALIRCCRLLLGRFIRLDGGRPKSSR